MYKPRSFYKWEGQFKNVRNSVTDEHRSGRLVKFSTPALEPRVVTLIQEDQRIRVKLVAEQLSLGTVSKIIS